jgi:hypothetical protein
MLHLQTFIATLGSPAAGHCIDGSQVALNVVLRATSWLDNGLFWRWFQRKVEVRNESWVLENIRVFCSGYRFRVGD